MKKAIGMGCLVHFFLELIINRPTNVFGGEELLALLVVVLVLTIKKDKYKKLIRIRPSKKVRFN